MNDWFETVWKILLGILLKHVWDKFAGRITYLHYTVNVISVGRAVADERYGTVEVKYNGNSMKNLYFCTVTIENRSNRDIKDIHLNVFGNTGNHILMSHGHVAGSPNSLKFSEAYQNTLTNAKDNAAALEVALGRRDYFVPVLNRGSIATIEFLGNIPDGMPAIYANCDHVGVKLKFVNSLPHFYGEPTNYCSWIGSFVALVLCFVLYKYIPVEYHYIAIFFSAFLGIFAVLLGWITMKTIRGVARIIG